MEATDNVNFITPNISLQNAYSEINFYSSNKKHKKLIKTCTNGPAQFAGLFSHLHHSQQSQNKQKKQIIKQQDEQEVVMCAQPFYVGQVDHNIEEIGIMAVREVRYVDDQQWEQIMKQNQRYEKAIKNQKLNQIKQIRKVQAIKRTRNQKGQFVSKQSNKKNKKLKKQKKKQDKSQLFKVRKQGKNNTKKIQKQNNNKQKQ